MWTLYLFGAFLVFTGIKMLFVSDEDVHPEKNLLLRLAKKLFPVTPELHGQKFAIRGTGRFTLTPLALVLLMVETTDLIFAVDSIPAIFAVTQKPFIVFTSNVFAILGLRSLYFVLAGAIDYFRYLKVGLSLVLVFIGGEDAARPARPAAEMVSGGDSQQRLVAGRGRDHRHLHCAVRRGGPPRKAGGAQILTEH